MASIDGLKAYVKDADALTEGDLATLNVCYTAAVEWFSRAGVPKMANNGLYDLGVYMLASSWFENRGAWTELDLNAIPQGVYAIKHLLDDVSDYYPDD